MGVGPEGLLAQAEQPVPRGGGFLEFQIAGVFLHLLFELADRLRQRLLVERRVVGLDARHAQQFGDDEFVLVATAPEQAGTVYWPVRQVCAEGRNDWVEVPQAGQKLSDLKSPAAALEILPSGGAAAHNH